jgi:hypothetical protein
MRRVNPQRTGAAVGAQQIMSEPAELAKMPPVSETIRRVYRMLVPDGVPGRFLSRFFALAATLFDTECSKLAILINNEFSIKVF